MQFLKILFWCLLAFTAAVFTFGNWTTVSIHLFGGLIAETNLPLLLFVTFLLGLVPTWLYQNAVRWRLRQKLTACERALADIRAVAALPPAATPPADPPVLDKAPPASSSNPLASF